jgi:hypothetical protein
MANERLVKLLKGHRVRIARALVRQTRALVPRYEQLDAGAQERNFLSLLLGVERLLEHGDDAPLLEVAAHVAQLRASMGFRVEDFSVAAMCFLPVIRRFVLEHAGNIAEGLDDYEEFESVALPYLGRAAIIFMDASEDPTQPNARAVLQKKLSAAGPMKPIRIERVTGTEEEESTLQSFALPFSVRSAG